MASVRSEIYNSSLKKTNKVSIIIIIIIAIINIIINFIFLGNDKYWMDGWWSVETDALRVAEKNISRSLIESKWSINGETSFSPTPTRLNSFSSDLA